MAEAKTQGIAAAAHGFSGLSVIRQLILLVGLAASVAVGVSIVLWSQKPNYQILYGALAEKDVVTVMDELQKANIPAKLDQTSGALMVPASKVHDARLKLAAQGLPKGSVGGFEIMDRDRGFGSSQFMELARYQHAMEGELVRSIVTLNSVRDARVHLAIPRQSVFVRNREKPSASVVLGLYPGRQLDDGQVAGIVHLVASSVPNLDESQVTVVDERGNLLSNRMSSRELALSATQFDHTRRVEDAYVKRVEEILLPIVGAGRVRAQVVAKLDFTFKEETQESFNPEKQVVRSEQTSEEETVGYAGAAGGIPGALTNQPPGTGQVPERRPDVPVRPRDAQGNEQEQLAALQPPGSKSRQATHNYELEKTISHTRQPFGSLERLSVAVVVDNKQTLNDDGEAVRAPYAEEELTRLTTLVKDAIGFDEARGDSVSVVNVAFQQPEAVEPLPEPPLWQQPWLWDVAKQVLGGLVALLLVLGVLRPVLRSLAEKGQAPVVFSGAPGEAALPVGEDQLSLSAPGAAQEITAQASANVYQEDLSATKTLVAEDPKRAAQVVKGWLATDGGQ